MTVRSKALAILIISLVVSSTNSFSQTKPSFVQGMFGFAIPMGEFSSKVLPDGGFALAGIQVGAEGAWFFKETLGIGAIGGAMIYPVDAYALTRETLNQDFFLESLNIRSESYLNYFFTPQFYYHLDLKPNLYFLFKAGAGVSYARSPYKLYKAEYAILGQRWFEITSAKNWTWNARGGLLFGWNFNNCLGLTAGADFFYSPTEFGFTRGDGSRRVENHYVMSVNPTIGILFQIR